MPGPGKIKTPLKESVALHIVLIALLGLLAYSNTFNVPFHFDDDINIVENPAVKDFRFFIHPSAARAVTSHAQYALFENRYVGFLTFALNYKLHGLNVRSYHIVNIAVHLINAVLVYSLVLVTLKIPFMEGYPLRKKQHTGNTRLPVSRSTGSAHAVALFSALLFVSHPVQTQAVTYIVQRFASLATMFYLLSIVLYIKARQGGGAEKQKSSIRALFYCFSFLTCVLAMKTKETAFTLPVAIVVYEFMFFHGKIKKRLVYLIPLVLTMLIIPLTLIDISKPLEEIIFETGEETVIRDISRFDYLLTELRVIITYIRLLILPVWQNLLYDYPVYHSLFELPVFLSFIVLLAVFTLGIYFLRRSSIIDYAFRLAAFGIFWFFLTLSVESSVIPLRPIFEHRVYLPSIGAFTAIASGIFLFVNKYRNTIQMAVLCFLISTVLVFSYATYARNSVWKGDITLWEDIIKKSPQNAIGYYNLGKAYMTTSLDKAIASFQIALTLHPGHWDTHNNLGLAYASKGLFDEGIAHYQTAIRLKPDFERAHFNLGLTYIDTGDYDKALSEFESALKINPHSSQTRQMVNYIKNLNP